MKTGLTSILTLVMINTIATAENLQNKSSKIENKEVNKSIPATSHSGFDDYISITGVSSYDQISVDDIEGVKLTFDPVISAGIKVILFPDKTDKNWFSNITLGYQKSFSKNEIANEGYQESEQMNLEVPIPKTSFALRYDNNRYTTSIQATDSKAYLIDKTNTTAITDLVSTNDQGVIVLNKNDTALLETTLEKFEVRLYGNNKQAYGMFFKEVVTKPWENPVSSWTSSDGEPLVSIFSQTKFESYGLGIGINHEDRFLHKGMNISKFRGSISTSDIFLTDNYNLEDRVKDYSALRYSIGGELAYKLKFNFISKNSAFIAALYGSYDYYDYSKDDDSTTENDFALSNDYQFGARVALSF